jgi:outer membrane protein assembly factor BamB
LKRIALVIVALLVLTGCSSVVTGESWGNLSASPDGKSVYLAYKNQLVKINITTNGSVITPKVAWQAKDSANPTFFAAPALSEDGQLFAGSYSTRSLYAFQDDTGAELGTWTVQKFTDRVVASPVVRGDMVYVGMGDRGIRAYNRKTKQEFVFNDTKFGVWGHLLVVGDVVYAASLDHHVYALNAATLEKLWTLDLGGAIADAPTWDGQSTLYVGTWNSEVVAIDISTAQPAISARFKTKNWVWGSPTYDAGTLYFGDLSGNLYALDAKNLQQKWTIPPETDAPGGIRGRVAVAKNINLIKVINNQPETTTLPLLIIYGTEGKKVYAVDGDGNLKWKSAVTMSDRILSDMLVVGGSVIFTTQSEDQLVVALNLSTGQVDWSLKAADAKLPDPTKTP